MRPDLPSIQAEEVEQHVITDAITGETHIVRGKVTTISVDPSTGAKRRVTTATAIRNSEGRVIDPGEPVYACACTKALLTKSSTLFCHRCQRALCVRCAYPAGEHHLCRHCWCVTLTARFWSWLKNI
jgi:hypothetical protein